MEDLNITIERDGNVVYITQGKSVIELYNPVAFASVFSGLAKNHKKAKVVLTLHSELA